jgi:hypothetical protein
MRLLFFFFFFFFTSECGKFYSQNGTLNYCRGNDVTDSKLRVIVLWVMSNGNLTRVRYDRYLFRGWVILYNTIPGILVLLYYTIQYLAYYVSVGANTARVFFKIVCEYCTFSISWSPCKRYVILNRKYAILIDFTMPALKTKVRKHNNYYSEVICLRIKVRVSITFVGRTGYLHARRRK